MLGGRLEALPVVVDLEYGHPVPPGKAQSTCDGSCVPPYVGQGFTSELDDVAGAGSELSSDLTVDLNGCRHP